ncbi:MAG: transketolase [Deltaproteobacteria bacterium]|nr:transketolase [Deltaproteobacteria bacterium]
MNDADPKLIAQLEDKARHLRKVMVKMMTNAGGGHLGPAMSSTDVATALFFHTMRISPENPTKPDRDRFIMSAGHKCGILYVCLADKGFISPETLDTFLEFDKTLGGHPDMKKIPGVDASTGSLGHGLSIGVGMALAGKYDKLDYRVFVLLGDGELDEGSNWEAAMSASHFKLDNLIAIVDRNRLQIDGTTEEVMALEPLADKWKSFGWAVTDIDGHDMTTIVRTLDHLPLAQGKPTMIIAQTTKGKGVSFMENQLSWHYRAPNKDEAVKALEELDTQGRKEGR